MVERGAGARIVASVGSVADAYDNAIAESFFGTLKTELVQGWVFTTRFEG
jgi:putative transposase